MYPMALMFVFPLSVLYIAMFPHVLESSGCPPVPNPILESGLWQSFSLFPRIPILALEMKLTALNPSFLQFLCKEALDPVNVFYLLRPSDVARYLPSAIRENNELACLVMTMNFICWSIFIPRQIFEKGVVQ